MARTIAPVKVATTTLTVATRDRVELQDLTDRVAGLPDLGEFTHGTVLVHSLHTTTALFINEFQDALRHDILTMVQTVVSPTGQFRHNDPAYSDCTRQNAWSHLVGILLGQTVQVPVEHGRLALGTWQRILFCELDGPQTRRIYVQVMGV